MTFTIAKIDQLPSLYTTGWVSEVRSAYELRDGLVVRGYVVLPHGFGKPWELRNVPTQSCVAKARKPGSRSRSYDDRDAIRSEDPVSALVQWAEQHADHLPSAAEAKDAAEASRLDDERQTSERLARRQARVDEGNRLMDALGRIVTDHTNGLSLSDRLDLAAVARALPGAFPTGVRSAAEVVEC